jgi:hypothetical protein
MLTGLQSRHSADGVSSASRNARASDREHSGQTVLPRTRRPQKQMQVRGPNTARRDTVASVPVAASGAIAWPRSVRNVSWSSNAGLPAAKPGQADPESK